MIYLDHASTTPLRPEVADAMARVQAHAFANPASLHAAGRRARGVLEEARERILASLGAIPTGAHRDGLVFTSGATEANRLGILGTARGALGSGRTPGRFLFSARDHTSIRGLTGEMARLGFAPEEIPLEATGVPAWTAALPRLITRDDGTAPWNIVSVTTACGQTGVIDMFSTVFRAAKQECFVHADASQAAGWIEGNGLLASASTVTLSPHKFGGPRGIGGLVYRRGIPISPLTAGSQESGLRGGTEPVALAEGFATALELAVAERFRERSRVAGLRDAFERRLVESARAAGIAACVLPLEDATRAPHLSTIAFPGLDRQAIVMAADLAGIACSAGTACASGSAEPSPALVAMGFSRAIVSGAVRFSFGRSSTDEDVRAAAEAIERVLKEMAR